MCGVFRAYWVEDSETAPSQSFPYSPHLLPPPIPLVSVRERGFGRIPSFSIFRNIKRNHCYPPPPPGNHFPIPLTFTSPPKPPCSVRERRFGRIPSFSIVRNIERNGMLLHTHLRVGCIALCCELQDPPPAIISGRGCRNKNDCRKCNHLTPPPPLRGGGPQDPPSCTDGNFFLASSMSEIHLCNQQPRKQIVYALDEVDPSVVSGFLCGRNPRRQSNLCIMRKNCLHAKAN